VEEDQKPKKPSSFIAEYFAYITARKTKASQAELVSGNDSFLLRISGGK